MTGLKGDRGSMEHFLKKAEAYLGCLRSPEDCGGELAVSNSKVHEKQSVSHLVIPLVLIHRGCMYTRLIVHTPAA